MVRLLIRLRAGFLWTLSVIVWPVILWPAASWASVGAGWVDAGTFALIIQLGMGLLLIFLAWFIKVKLKIPIPKLLQVPLIWIGAFIVFRYILQPPIPLTLLIIYMGVSTIAILLYASIDQPSWEDFSRPIRIMLQEDYPRAKMGRYITFTALPLFLAYGTYDKLLPKFEEPIELRTVHPAPPASINVHNNVFTLQTAQNPFRVDDSGAYLAVGKEVVYQGKNAFQEHPPKFLENVKAGGEVFFGTAGCFFCHGDNLNGAGPFAYAFNPIPANFTDPGTIAQLQETFIFWRVAKGGPGLSREGFPWASAMPPWEKHLTTDEIWQAILFEYWHTGYFPRSWDE